MADILLQLLLRTVTVTLFTGLLSFVLFHAASYLKFPRKGLHYSNALYVSGILGGFVLITGLVLLLVPVLAESAFLRVLLVVSNMLILVSMIKLFYKVSWKKAFYGWGTAIIALLFLGVLVGIVLGVFEQLF
jgi:hypothetical protein